MHEKPQGCPGVVLAKRSEAGRSRANVILSLAMHFAYLLRSETDPERTYVGLTDNLERRLAEHNEGKSIHTNKFRPWKLMTSIAFDERENAEAFERYLKSHSGRSFSKKHL